jgi:alkylation response protein AidB-like acyl-CoA dehydrogenase
MDLGWTEEQAQLRATIAAFARAELNEGLAEREARSEFHREGWRRCAQMGVHGLPVPAEYGGMGVDALTTMGVLESLGEGCKDNGLVFSINAHMWTLEMPLLGFGTEDQKQRWLPRLCSGELIGGNAMSEPGSGSDAYALATRAEKRGDRYRLTGSKVFVSNGPVADLYLVFATVDPALGANGVSAFLVERQTPGLTVGTPVHKMGLRTSPMSELFFDGCEIPADHLLGREGAGKNLFTDSMTWERSCILASAVGAMQRLLDTTVRYANQRKQFGQPISRFQLVASRLVDMKVRLETSRALLYRAGWMKDQGRSIFLEAALAKLHISESWVACAQDAIQIHGGYGYMAEYEVERELRDAIASRIYSGTSEIQRLIIAPLLGV